MNQLENILGRISDFCCTISTIDIVFPGVLIRTNEKIFLQGRISLEDSRKVDYFSPIKIWGNVCGLPVILLDTYLENAQYIGGEQFGSLTFSPSEIVIGADTHSTVTVTHISTSISGLDYMFSSSPLKPTSNISREHPSVLNFTFPEEIIADDKYGQLKIYQTFESKWSRNEIIHEIIPIIEYQFHRPMEIMNAVERVATAINLFSFFANHYLPVGTFSFSNEHPQNAGDIIYDDCVLFLNHKEDISPPQEPFLVTTSEFSKDFSGIWKKWLTLYEEAMYIPTLFYEIICNRSTLINLFLNMSQAIEIYSRKYRQEMVKNVAQMREKTKEGRTPPVHLNHRFEDIFMLLASCIGIEADKFPILAKALADMRNFYTHYDDQKCPVEPSYQDIFAACHILEFVLLAVVYHTIGISGQHIDSCRGRVQFQRFNENIQTLIDYSSKRNAKPS